MEKQLKPKLNFPSFENKWVSKKIGDYYENLRTGMTPYRGKPYYYEGDIPWITSGELNYNRIRATRETISELALKETNLKLYPVGTLFIAITGLEAPGTRGRCAINSVPSTTNQSCLAFEKTSEIDTIFLYYWYLKYGEWLYSQFAQGTKQQSFNNKIVKKFEFIHPSLPEQQKIASFLTDVDEVITKLTKKKSLLEQYKKGVMQKIFNQELRFKDNEGNDFPDWEEKKLSLVGKIITGKTPSTSNKKLWGGDIQFVTPTDINEDEKYQKSTNRTVNFNEKLKVLPKHSIIYTCIASIGKMALSVHPCITNQQINSLVPNKGFNNEYIYYVLLQITPKIKSTQANTTLPIINKTEFSKFKIPVPCLEEQTKIANFLSDIDVKIEALNIKIENSKTFKKGLLQKMFV